MKNPSWLSLSAMAIMCFGTPIAGWIFFNKKVDDWYTTMAERGQFGDQFGALNTLFSGLAAGGVIFTLYLSYRQLQLQHSEFTSRTKSLQEGQVELAKQTRIIAHELTHSPTLHPMVAAEDAIERADKVFDLACVEIRHQINHEEANGGRAEEMRVNLEKFLSQTESYLNTLSELNHSVLPHVSSTPRVAASLQFKAEEKERISKHLIDWAQSLRINREIRQG